MKRFRIANAGRGALCSLLVAAILLVTLVPSDLPIVSPQKVEAFSLLCPAGASDAVVAGSVKTKVKDEFTRVPVNSDWGIFAVSAQATMNTGSAADRECYLDFIIKTLSRAVVHQLVTAIIDWINRGFEGGPTFVTDPAGFFGEIADQEIGRMIDGSALGFVCDPFRLQIQLSFLQQRDRRINPSYCSITSIIKNFQSFVDGNFNQGGWEGWIAMTSLPQNNPYGSQILAEEIVATRITSRQNIAETALNWGGGFKSILANDGTVKTPGSLINGQLAKATGNELDYLNLAREFDDIVIALASLGINKIMEAGLK